MSRLSTRLRKLDDGRISFWCPGCDEAHVIRVESRDHPVWTWNGDVDAPTFSPSILVTGTRITAKGEADYQAWMAAGYPDRKGEMLDNEPVVCHSFVNQGRIEFLRDCTHHLAGQTVDLPDWRDE